MTPEIEAALQREIDALWGRVKPSNEAQSICARLSTAFDSKESKDGWLGDNLPDYVWKLAGIAAQWGIYHGREVA